MLLKIYRTGEIMKNHDDMMIIKDHNDIIDCFKLTMEAENRYMKEKQRESIVFCVKLIVVAVIIYFIPITICKVFL